MPAAASLAYLPTTAYEWTERAFRLLETERLTVSPHGTDDAPVFVVAGPCPRCDHHFVDRQVTVALTGMGGVSRGDDSDASRSVVLDVTCGCGAAHEDAPEGATGCGVSFRIELAAE
ncbi:hypothetical protein [Streptomyces sp. NPDC003023]|uniref:hypothetical protein n=1 Tax=Streptomyces sp. NPDC003023 TaxID=3364675 RepID=UPI0036B5D0EC